MSEIDAVGAELQAATDNPNDMAAMLYFCLGLGFVVLWFHKLDKHIFRPRR
jgi:hypothetical protein|eukprot:COSAG06_NODE_7369_length_2527_cov_1.616969_3_plen_51_part_00